MSVSAITSNTAAAASADTTSSTGSTDSTTTLINPSSELNQADFLQLLVAQIQYQDPMNPQSDTDMAAQMAQFSTLQESTQSTSSLAMMQANSLVGSTVTIQVDSTDSTSGVVSGVVMSDGQPEITVGGANYELSQITAVSPATANSNVAAGGATNGTAANNSQTNN